MPYQDQELVLLRATTGIVSSGSYSRGSLRGRRASRAVADGLPCALSPNIADEGVESVKQLAWLREVGRRLLARGITSRGPCPVKKPASCSTTAPPPRGRARLGAARPEGNLYTKSSL